MTTLLGTQLSAVERRHALAAFPHRFTKDHVPSWTRRPQPNGMYANVQFASDYDWLAHTRFNVKKNGDIDMRSKRCEQSPTWPDSMRLLDAPYGSGGGGGGARVLLKKQVDCASRAR